VDGKAQEFMVDAHRTTFRALSRNTVLLLSWRQTSTLKQAMKTQERYRSTLSLTSALDGVG